VSDWVVRREVEVVDEEEEMSRRRCSTPISSASSASMEVGTCVKVRWVAVPSYEGLA
jgi:hypothetical protein